MPPLPSIRLLLYVGLVIVYFALLFQSGDGYQIGGVDHLISVVQLCIKNVFCPMHEGVQK